MKIEFYEFVIDGLPKKDEQTALTNTSYLPLA